MTKDIILVHGAFAGPWSMELYAKFFHERGWNVHTPAFRYHDGADTAENDNRLTDVSALDYTDDIAKVAEEIGTKPIILGHAIGGLIAQKVAAIGLASGVVLINPNTPHGFLPSTDDERAVARGLMESGAFWKETMHLPFEMFAEFALNKLPVAEQHKVFDQLGAESGRVMFEMFFWMFDDAAAIKVDFDSVQCPVLIVSGTEDRAVNPISCQELALKYGDRATFLAAEGYAHFLFLEPGWEKIADKIETWIKAKVG